MTENKNKEKPEKKKSVIVEFIRRIKSAFYVKATGGFFGRKAESFDKVNQMLENSFITSLIGKRSKFGKALLNFRFFVANQFENSISLLLWRKLLSFLAGCRIRLYGVFFSSLGLFTLLTYLARRYIFNDSDFDFWRLIFSAVLVIISIPMIVTDKTFFGSFNDSKIGRFVLRNILGVPENKIDVSKIKHVNAYNFAVVAGVAVGALSFFVDPIVLFAIFAGVIVEALVLYSPETGIIITLIGLPFAALFGNDTLIIASVALFSLSYLMKLLRCKRVLRFEITDVLLLLFAFVVIGGSIKSDAYNIKNVIIHILMVFGCFVIGNIMRTKAWQKRIVLSYIFAASVIAIFVVFELVLGDLWSFAEIFGENGFLSTPLSEATFMLPAFFATLTFACFSETVKGRIASLLLTLIFVAAIAATDPAFGYYILIGSAVLFLILKRETISVLIVGAVAVPVTLTLLPWSVAKTIGKAFDLSSVVNYSASKIFQGSSNMMTQFWLSGIGSGNFSIIYPYFAAVGYKNAEQLPSTFLRIFENYGIIGILLILAVIALFLLNCFGFIKISGKSRFKIFVAACVASAICLVLKSMFFNTTEDIKTLFVMFCLFYVTCAAIKNGQNDIQKSKIMQEDFDFSASVEI